MPEAQCINPPQNLDAERALLGLAIHGGHAKRLAAELSPRDFVLGRHQHLWHAVRFLADEGREVDAILVADELERRGSYEAAGGVEYLAELTPDMGRIFGPEEYLRTVREKSALRRLQAACHKIALECSTENPAELASRAEAAVRSAAEQIAENTAGMARYARDIIREAGGPDALFAAATRGLQTPWDGLNRLTLGMHRGQMIVLAGRTGRGKSAAASQIAAYALLQNAGPVIVFSLEMRGDAIIRRMACGETGVSANVVRRGDTTNAERSALARAAMGFENLVISDRMQVTISSIRSTLLRHSASGPVALAIVDYLQLMAGNGKAENRQTEIAALSRALKQAAVEFGIPLLVLCQYNREADRSDGRPGLHHLRESGAIGHDADMVWLLHEPEGTGELGWKAKLIVAKQREGPEGDVNLWFDRNRTKFEADECAD